MRSKLAAAALIALGTLAATTTTATTAEARDGCGPGFHRNWSGWCKPNWRPYAYRPVVYARPVVVGYGWRHGGWHRPWGWRHAGWHHRSWGHGGFHRAGWHHRGWGGHRHRW